MLTHTIHIDEGVYVNSSGGQIKDVRLQWGEVPSSIGEYILTRWTAMSRVS